MNLQKILYYLVYDLSARIKSKINYNALRAYYVRASSGSCGTHLAVNGPVKGFNKKVIIKNHVNINLRSTKLNRSKIGILFDYL
jgi:hypothetical protein